MSHQEGRSIGIFNNILKEPKKPAIWRVSSVSAWGSHLWETTFVESNVPFPRARPKAAALGTLTI